METLFLYLLLAITVWFWIGFIRVLLTNGTGSSQVTKASSARRKKRRPVPDEPFTQSSKQTRMPSPRPDLALDEAYNLLGVERTATKLEVRRAYRKLMAQHHPDTLAAKGFSPEVIKTGAIKTQKIKAAYELIKKATDW